MQYPLISEYVRAIQDAESNLDSLSHLVPVLDDHGEPYRSSGAFAVVFKMKDEQTGKYYALKCFTEEQDGRAEAYQQIADELEFIDSSYLTSVKYLDKELFVDCSCEDEEFPVLLMDWVEGETMETYIANNYTNSYDMGMLCYRFCKMAAWLRSQPFAHGDIKPDNIIVRPDGSLTLVDYDGMYVPAMKGQQSPTIGTRDFSHPLRSVDDFDETIDDFALASIALSLKAISLKSSLLDDYGASDRLLFSTDDYRDLSNSKVLGAMQELANDDDMKSLLAMFLLVCAQKNLAMCSFRLLMLAKPDRNLEGDNLEELISLADKYYENKDYTQAFAFYSEAASRGSLYALACLGGCYIEGEGVLEDKQKGVALIKESAEKGNAEGQVCLGYCYYNGYGVAQDYAEAIKCFRLSAGQGNYKAQNNLGFCYLIGLGNGVLARDYARSVMWFRKSAEQGYSEAQFYLGICYGNGHGVAKNHIEALKWFRKSAEQGNSKAQKQLGYYYYYGKEVAQDYIEAVKWYRKVAEQGDSYAQNKLGECYYNGYGITQDYTEAVKWYRMAAEQGYSEAQNSLGNRYYNGEGVEKDYTEAVKWYRKSADQGCSDAQSKVGLCYYRGVGVEKDYVEAVKWWNKSAKQGHSDAQRYLGYCYEFGKGVAQNHTEAVKLYKKSAEQGNTIAQYTLARCYEEGMGVPKSHSEAMKWYEKSANRGNTDAKKMLDK